jgi:Na+-transporting methylmalonyl-CoA/oxaloacetate decarboxylase gamma subunit
MLAFIGLCLLLLFLAMGAVLVAFLFLVFLITWMTIEKVLQRFSQKTPSSHQWEEESVLTGEILDRQGRKPPAGQSQPD